MKTIKLQVIVPSGLSEVEVAEQILLAETRMNSESLLRFHLKEVLETHQEKPICEIVNGQFAWTLKVDKKTINFQGASNVDYFKSIYENLGYQVVIS
jgi:hypothetical protein